METSPSPSALQRKARSEALLAAEAVPVNRHLPVIEDESGALRRSTEEVAQRAMALLVVAVKAEGLEQEIVDEIVRDYEISPYLSPREQAFVADAEPSESDRTQFIWRYEAAWTLLWALGYVDELEKPTGICDVPQAVTFMQQRSARQFIEDARLRPHEEILEQADRIYRYHWAVVDARIKDQPAPAELDPGVTMERHYALNWLIGYMEQAWDDISTDT